MRIAAWLATAGMALAACAGAGDVDVEPADPGSEEPRTELTVVLDESGTGDTRTITLTCEPAGGDHPDPSAACAALAAAGGTDAFAPVPPDAACTEQYGGPQTARVTGTVDGEPVDARLSRVNGCEISRWDALAAVLDSPGGVQDP